MSKTPIANNQPPPLCAECSKIIEDSNLHFVQCGGLAVGLHRQPLVWRLRDKDECLMSARRTKELQKMAAAMRYLVQCIPYLPIDLANKVLKFCGIADKGLGINEESS
jgi:hypothetical protein